MFSYGSPIEEFFHHNAEKYLDERLLLESQVPVQTFLGTFVVDFMLVARNGRRIAFECDGAEFHDARRDECRDAIILGENQADVMYHIPGAAIHHQIARVFKAISGWDPDIITDRARLVLERLDPGWTLQDPSSESAFLAFGSVLDRRTRQIPVGKRAFWTVLHRLACEQRPPSLDAFVAWLDSRPVPRLGVVGSPQST